MANESILISEVIPASPQRIFSAWLDSAEHSALTGSQASVEPTVGGEHTAWDGYVRGKTLELHDGARIVQSWRTTEFPDDSPDSRVEITLEPTVGGTLVTLHHTDIPAGQSDRYREGWNEYYLSRMKTYFAEGGGDADSDDHDADDPTVPLGRMPGDFERTEIATQFSTADADEPTQETSRDAIESTSETTDKWTSVMTSARKMANAVVDAVTGAVKKTAKGRNKAGKKSARKPRKLAAKPRASKRAKTAKRGASAKPKAAAKKTAAARKPAAKKKVAAKRRTAKPARKKPKKPAKAAKSKRPKARGKKR